MTGIERTDATRNLRGTFPESWGVPPVNLEERRGWIRRNVQAAGRYGSDPVDALLRIMRKRYW